MVVMVARLSLSFALFHLIFGVHGHARRQGYHPPFDLHSVNRVIRFQYLVFGSVASRFSIPHSVFIQNPVFVESVDGSVHRFAALISNFNETSVFFLFFFSVRRFSMCVLCVFSPHSFWTSMDVPAGVTQEEGHTGFLIHLLSAVRALIFLARRIQPFLSLVNREVEFCVLTILIVLHPFGIFIFVF